MIKTTVPSRHLRDLEEDMVMTIFPLLIHRAFSVKRDSSSVEEDVFVFGVGNLLSALQSPDGFSHVFGLQRWRVAPLLTHVKSWSARKKNIMEAINEAYGF